VSAILVTGASGGVGRGIALACASTNLQVWVAARRSEQSRMVAAEVDAAGGIGRFITCDVGDRRSVFEAVEAAASGAGGLKGVVHNATSQYSSQTAALGDARFEHLQDHIKVSLHGALHLAQASLPHLEEAGGSFVILTSEASFEGKPLLAQYAMVKAAQRGFMRTLAQEWGPRGVRVNAVGPLAATSAMERAFVSEPSMATRVLGRIPLGRLGDPAEDIGPVVRFLLSDDARYVTGQTLMVDGGSCPIV
jgi:NAD(P)-dependent dehydrogenase (short-subunit alcohol dehydrogenase family)